MAPSMMRLSVCVLLLLLLVAVTEGAPKAKKVKCQDKWYTNCYHKDLYCPADCLRTCVVDCASCQPVCELSPPQSPSPPPPSPSPPPPHAAYPPPAPTPPTLTPTPAPPLPQSPPQSPPPPTPRTPTPTPPLPQSPPQSPPPTTSSPPSTSPKQVYCNNKYYPHCYRMAQYCPSACPDQCEVDCVTCSPVCNCNRPGAVCQDPRFIGGDGITFYFHGKKDLDFCVVSDSNLHINAHFIGKRNQNMRRDFTWVQSLGILFDTHQLFVGAMKTTTWNNAVDRLALSFDGQPILLSEGKGTKWQAQGIFITRSEDTNAVVIQVEGNFRIKATVVPITEKDSRIHNYGVTDEDCFAHLDLSFKFYSLSGDVNGVLGQTYGSNYVSKVKMGVVMPVLGGDKDFTSSSLFATDCAVARFSGHSNSSDSFEYANLKCASGMDGRGVVCKR